jgi:hypothetical protein
MSESGQKPMFLGTQMHFRTTLTSGPRWFEPQCRPWANKRLMHRSKRLRYFDYPIGAGEQCRGKGEAKCLSIF